jgi:hypothetical protein
VNRSRTGFDLYPDQCRVVEVHLRPRDGVSGDVRVSSFALLAEGRMSPSLSWELARLRDEQRLSRDAWVTIWGLGSDQAEIARQIQPLVDAGFDIQGVCTPAMALTAVARRHERTAPDTAVAYVALEPSAMCLAIVRDGVLLFSRETPWEVAASADTIVDTLADELRRSFLFVRQSLRIVVERIVLCGGMPRLRALTSPIGSALSLPVETLDSLSGIDAQAVPEPADAFRASVAALWVAIAVAAESGDRSRPVPVVAGAIAALAMLAAFYFFPRPAPVDPVPDVAPPPPPPQVESPKAAAPAEVIPEPKLVVGSILYSSQRRLAIINGRIVGVGDRIGASTILYIEPRAVIVQSADGTKRTLTLR